MSTTNLEFWNYNFFSQNVSCCFLNFIYSEKATKVCEILTLLLTTVNTVKSKRKILQNFVAFSEYMNFTFRNLLSYLLCFYRKPLTITSTVNYYCIKIWSFKSPAIIRPLWNIWTRMRNKSVISFHY